MANKKKWDIVGRKGGIATKNMNKKELSSYLTYKYLRDYYDGMTFEERKN